MAFFESRAFGRTAGGLSGYNQAEYQHYVLVTTKEHGQKIESGWDYASDAKDHMKELAEAGIPGRVFTKTGVKRAGLNPDHDSSWWGSEITHLINHGPR